MPELIKIYWRDIPSQVTAKAGRKTAKVMLPARFQEGIDRAAMRAGKGSSDAYMEDWRRERSPCSAQLQIEAETAAAKLVQDLDEAALELLVKAKGIAAHVGMTREQIATLTQPAGDASKSIDEED
ncbi:virulence factor [Granulosicoccus antarcticus]|uniref:Virulence factor domain-containing protein n=1 Tax=Granulosicoccus antarcticus IMCC3135 TaxID=1192854 RepID=A0A2Z2NVU3_9GAMM|nr:virulence factor [Granulosicoccus antarcticus]ASJ75586.1 hypothetical protein IMCC3135_27665 [Granulosicoccus antarcticus IMCC3135]